VVAEKRLDVIVPGGSRVRWFWLRGVPKVGEDESLCLLFVEMDYESTTVWKVAGAVMWE